MSRPPAPGGIFQGQIFVPVKAPSDADDRQPKLTVPRCYRSKCCFATQGVLFRSELPPAGTAAPAKFFAPPKVTLPMVVRLLEAGTGNATPAHHPGAIDIIDRDRRRIQGDRHAQGLRGRENCWSPQRSPPADAPVRLKAPAPLLNVTPGQGCRCRSYRSVTEPPK